MKTRLLICVFKWEQIPVYIYIQLKDLVENIFRKEKSVIAAKEGLK